MNVHADSKSHPSRRRFLALVTATLAAVATRSTTSSTEASASAGTVNKALVWRLDSHWGYETGPRKKTHCECSACIRHATNKVFATHDAAEAGRAHTNCVCQVRAVQINADGYDKLFQGTTSVDLRNSGTASLYTQLLVPSK